MVKLVKAYLLQNKSVSIPGLGTIYIERIPAQSDFVNRQLLPPAYHFRFDKYFDTPGKDFFSFIASREQIYDFEAMKMFNEWALELKNNVAGIHQASELDGIGIITRDDSGNIIFEPTDKPKTFDKSIAAERIVRSNASHTMLVGDKETTTVAMTDYYNEEEIHREKKSWWIYALILAAIALIMIFFSYYNKEGTSPFGSQQKIKVK